MRWCLEGMKGFAGDRGRGVLGEVFVTGDTDGDLLRGCGRADGLLRARPGRGLRVAGDCEGAAATVRRASMASRSWREIGAVADHRRLVIVEQGTDSRLWFPWVRAQGARRILRSGGWCPLDPAGAGSGRAVTRFESETNPPSGGAMSKPTGWS